jgi:formylglycine-generating enzyme required for sulfatase activity
LAAKIFISYRRDDAKDQAARLRDRLAARDAFGAANVFMDVDQLIAGQRFDQELKKALDGTDVLLAVIGPRWTDILAARASSGERDYVREEIAAALARGIIVIPVLVDRAALPRAGDLPEDIRDLVMHQKHDIVYETFGRDTDALIRDIKLVLKGPPKPAQAVPWKAIAALVILVAAGMSAYVLVPSYLPKVKEAQQPNPVETPVAVVTPPPPIEAACDGVLVPVGLSGQKQCIKPGSGQSFKDCPDCPEMVVVPSGSFIMGSPDSEPERLVNEGPQHRVTIPKPFAVGKFAVTFAERDACEADGGCGGYIPQDEGWGRADRPVINVSWDDAQAYVTWLSKKTGKMYRLLSEAEFEYAARAGTTTPFWWGRSIAPDQANYDGNYVYAGGGSKGEYRGKTVPVKSLEPNPWGLYQVHGNAWTWMQDCYVNSYKDAPKDGSAARETAGCSRVLRGGSWNSNPRFLRSANRFGVAVIRINDIGFRVARTL